MTKQEITDWMKSHKCIGSTDFDVDKCDNKYYTLIYTDGVKLYAIQTMDGRPLEKWDTVGYVRGVYDEPNEVVRKTRMVEETYYESVNEN